VAACTTAKTTANDNLPESSGWGFGPDLARAQTFKVPGAVTLDRVGLYLGAVDDADVTVRIYSGDPEGLSTPLGSPVTRRVSIVGTAFAEFDFTGDPIQLSPGTPYFIEAQSTDGFWALVDPGAYSDGSAYTEDGLGTVNESPDVDFLFQVFGTTCTADPTPNPTSPIVATPDITKPVLTGSTMSSSVFQAAKSGPAFTSKVGTKVSFTVSEASAVKFTVQRKTKGRRVAGKCRRQTKRTAPSGPAFAG
jgi:hypothetical protein